MGVAGSYTNRAGTVDPSHVNIIRFWVVQRIRKAAGVERARTFLVVASVPERTQRE